MSILFYTQKKKKNRPEKCCRLLQYLDMCFSPDTNQCEHIWSWNYFSVCTCTCTVISFQGLKEFFELTLTITCEGWETSSSVSRTQIEEQQRLVGRHCRTDDAVDGETSSTPLLLFLTSCPENRCLPSLTGFFLEKSIFSFTWSWQEYE